MPICYNALHSGTSFCKKENLTSNLLTHFVNKISGDLDIIKTDPNFEHNTKLKRDIYDIVTCYRGISSDTNLSRVRVSTTSN
jgi:hypothetical protein